jgi:hypothetical protein
MNYRLKKENTMLECTVNREVAVDDGKKQVVPAKIMINEDHVRAIQPRIEGGCVVSFADQSAMIIAESMTEIKSQMSGDADAIEKA